MFPAIRTAFAVSMIGLGLIALLTPAHAQSSDSRNRFIVAPKAERSEGGSRVQRIQIPKAEREQSRRIEVVGRASPRFNAPKAERFTEPSRPSRQEFQAPKAERIERAEAPIRERVKRLARNEAPVRNKPKFVEEDAPANEIVEDETPAKVVKTKKHFVAKSEPKVIHADSSDDDYGYYDDYGHYTDAGYSDHGYGYNSCQ